MPRSQDPQRSQKGYTAMELTFAVFIMGLAIFSVVKLYKVFSQSFWTVSEKSQLNQVVSFTMDQVVSSIREARSVVYLVAVTPTITATPVVARQVVHLDVSSSTPRAFCALSMPNLADPGSATNDTILFYFLRKLPDGTVKLYQRMRYYNGTYTPCVPAMAHINRLRASTNAAFFPPEPTPGGTVEPYPNTSPTPTPSYQDKLGKMPGMYGSPKFSFEDVSFYYDNANSMLSFGLSARILSLSRPFRGYILRPNTIKDNPAAGRRRSMTTTVNLRRSQ